MNKSRQRIMNASFLACMAAVAVSAIGFSATVSVSAAQAQATVPASSSGTCPGGYRRGQDRNRTKYSGGMDTSLCYETSPGSGARDKASGEAASREANTFNTSAGTIRKSDRMQRCPAGYWTTPDNLMVCGTQVTAAPPRSRLKGTTTCRAGELEEWGVWCTSDTGRLSKLDVTQAASRDFNTIYSNTGQFPASDRIYDSPTVLALFREGAAAATPTSPAATPSRAAAPAAPRAASRNAQRGNAQTIGCPATWADGIIPGTWAVGERGMCYPQPQSTASYPIASRDAPCASGFVQSGSGWCSAPDNSAASNAAIAAQSRAQASATPVNTAATPANCPAPASGAAQQAGSALGGLLGGRRGGNSQAGAVLGGLLGGAVASQANKPAGCP